VSNILKKLIFL